MGTTRIALLGLIALAWAFSSALRAGQDAPWSAPQQLSRGPRPARILYNFGWAIDVDGAGVIHVAWVEVHGLLDSRQPMTVIGRVLYRRSFDAGRSWTPAVALAASGGPPKVAAAGSHVYVAWHTPADGALAIQVRCSAEHGAAWSPPLTVSDAGIGAAWPSIDAWGDAVHVVWGDSRTGRGEIYVRSSADAGAAWTATRAVSSADGFSSWTPSVAAWGDAIHVAWSDERHNRGAGGEPFDCASVGPGDECREEEYYRRSLDFGRTWDDELRLSHDLEEPHSSWAPSIAAWEDDVHVMFFDRRSGAWDIYYTRSRSRGTAGSWQLDRPIARGSVGGLQLARPSLAVRAKGVHAVFWGAAPDGTSNVYALGSSDAGAHFDIAGRISGGDGNHALHPSLAVSPDGRLHAVWYDRDARGVDQVFHSTGVPPHE